MHTPVLLKEVIEGLNIKEGGLYIDATAGEGGYIKEILRRGARVLGIDWDNDQIKSLKNELKNYKDKIELVYGNFAEIEKIAKEKGFSEVEGIVFDLGLSMKQLKKSKKGFSYRALNDTLDMRLSDNVEEKASDFLNKAAKDELYEVFARYSEELNSEEIAEAILKMRKHKQIEKVSDLIKIIDYALDGRSDDRVYSRIFQALRIKVNNEFENLKEGLKGALKVLKKEGRLVVVSFHSGEDRIVKQFIKANNLKMVNKKAIKGSRKLSFERSAKLRIIGN